MDFRGIIEFIKDTAKYIILIIVVLFIAIYIISLQQIIGPSMSPNLKNGDVVLLNKAKYYFFDVKRNDVISFKYKDTKYLVKRVIGLPGETISYKNNILYIDGKAYSESISENTVTNDFDLKDLGYDRIPDDMYLVLGDNRVDSLDSRDFGLVKKEDIIGEAFLRIWPITGFKVIK